MKDLLVLYLKKFTLNFALALIALFILTLFNYFNILPLKVLYGLLLLLPVFLISASAFFLGNNSRLKGYLSGIINWLFTAVIMLILSLASNVDLTFKSLIYFLILLVISIISAIIGVNKKTIN